MPNDRCECINYFKQVTVTVGECIQAVSELRQSYCPFSFDSFHVTEFQEYGDYNLSKKQTFTHNANFGQIQSIQHRIEEHVTCKPV